MFKLPVLSKMALFHLELNQEWAFEIIAKESCNQNSHQIAFALIQHELSIKVEI